MNELFKEKHSEFYRSVIQIHLILYFICVSQWREKDTMHGGLAELMRVEVKAAEETMWRTVKRMINVRSRVKFQVSLTFFSCPAPKVMWLSKIHNLAIIHTMRYILLGGRSFWLMSLSHLSATWASNVQKAHERIMRKKMPSLILDVTDIAPTPLFIGELFGFGCERREVWGYVLESLPGCCFSATDLLRF